jgi:4-amino-4-deoxy-L-arabinose transferase-like glycosyltransferase
MAAFVRAELETSRSALVLFYALTGAAFWAKGPAGLLPLLVAAVYCLTRGGIRELSRLASAPGLALLVLIVIPWWVVGAVVGREQFAEGAVQVNFVRWYLPTVSRGLGYVWTPIKDGFTIILPWGLALPLALAVLWRGRGLDAERDRRVTLLLVWAAVVLVAVGLSNEQRLRYYLPLCAPVALLLSAGYERLQWPRRAVAFGLVWLLFAGGLVAAHVPLARRQNARTDLRDLQRLMRESPAPLLAYGPPDLVLAFYLERPVQALRAEPDTTRLASAVATGYVAIADRYLPAADGLGLRRVATGLADRRPFTVVARE